jgi:hypothetical protein
VDPPLSLADLRYDDGEPSFTAHRHRETESRLADYLAEARALLASPPPPIAASVEGSAALAVGPDFEALRWFWLPHEAAAGLTPTA